MDAVRSRIVAAVGEAGAAELLDVLTRPDADRAALIGRLHQRQDAAWLTELLMDLEEDDPARLLRVLDRSPVSHRFASRAPGD